MRRETTSARSTARPCTGRATRSAQRREGLARALPARADPRGPRDVTTDSRQRGRSTTPSRTTSSTWREPERLLRARRHGRRLPSRHGRRDRLAVYGSASTVAATAPRTRRSVVALGARDPCRDVDRNHRDDDHEQRDVHDRLLDRSEEVRESRSGSVRWAPAVKIVTTTSSHERAKRAARGQHCATGEGDMAERLPRVAAEVGRRFLEVAVEAPQAGHCVVEDDHDAEGRVPDDDRRQAVGNPRVVKVVWRASPVTIRGARSGGSPAT